MDRRYQLQDIEKGLILDTSNFSKRSRLRECFRRIKRELSHPIECSTRRHSPAQYFHHFRRWKNPEQSYSLIRSVSPIHKEVFVMSEEREEKKRECNNDFRRMIYVGNSQYADSEQYEMGCMILRWYLENRSRETQDDVKFEWKQEDSNNTSLTSITVPLEVESVHEKDIKNLGIIDSDKDDSMHNHTFERGQVNEKIIDDLVKRIDDLVENL